MAKAGGKHHFIPKFYLAGFTLGGRPDDWLWVTDLIAGNQRRVRAANEGYSSGFYRIDLPGVSPTAVEDDLATIEGEIAPVLRQVISRKVLPSSADEMDLLLKLVALMSERVPLAREATSLPDLEVRKYVLRMLAASSEAYEAAIRSVRERQPERQGGDLSYERFKEMVENEEFAIEVDQSWLIHLMYLRIEAIVPCIRARKWCLLKSNDSDFICSDNPVSLTWSQPQRGPRSPGWGLPDTTATMPLSRDLALHGRFEGTTGVIEVGQSAVASINTRTASRAGRSLYSPRATFQCFVGPGDVGGPQELIEMLAASESAGRQ